MKKNIKPFNVIIEDNGRFRPYDIMPRLVGSYDELKKKAPSKRYKPLPETDEEIKQFVKSESQYNWWAKCEYEVILQDWPCQRVEKKIDVYDQIQMNFDLICEIFKENVGK